MLPACPAATNDLFPKPADPKHDELEAHQNPYDEAEDEDAPRECGESDERETCGQRARRYKHAQSGHARGKREEEMSREQVTGARLV